MNLATYTGWVLLVLCLLITIMDRRDEGIDSWRLNLETSLVIFIIASNMILFLLLAYGWGTIVRAEQFLRIWFTT